MSVRGFSLKRSNSFCLSVTFKEPTEKADHWDTVRFVARFKHLPRPECEALLEKMQNDGMAISEVLDEVLIGIESGVEGMDSGEVTPEQALQGVKDHTMAGAAAFRKWVESFSEGVESKNSKRSRRN